MKIFILLSISNDAPVPFLQILPSISNETTVSSFQIFIAYFNSKFINLVRYYAMLGQLFSKKTNEGSRSILYCVSQNRFSVRHPIQSEKYRDAKSYMSTGFVPYFKDNYHEYIS